MCLRRDSKTLEEPDLPRNQKALIVVQKFIDHSYTSTILAQRATCGGNIEWNFTTQGGVHVRVRVSMYVCARMCVYAFFLVSIAPKLPCTVTDITIRGGA